MTSLRPFFAFAALSLAVMGCQPEEPQTDQTPPPPAQQPATDQNDQPEGQDQTTDTDETQPVEGTP